MFQIKKQLTNSRPPKSTEKTLTTSPTPGTIKMSEEAGISMNVRKGDYVGIIQGTDEVFYLYKGSEGKDGSSNDGAKVATANEKSSGTMQFSSANAYQSLGGNANSTEVFTIGEAKEHEGKDYFPLTFKESIAKQPRSKKDKVTTDEVEA